MSSLTLPDTPNGSISRADQVGRMLFMASHGDAEGIQEMLDAGVHVNLADYDGRTALHLAASEGRVNVVKLLLERGADANPIDRHGNTPLVDAQSYGSAEMCHLLKQYGGATSETSKMRNINSSATRMDDFEIDPSELDMSRSKVIGQGAFGEVRAVSWRGTPVAVKMIRDELSSDPLAEREFRDELLVLRNLRHPNIVQFLGAVTKSRPLMLITEYLSKGNLKDIMRRKGTLKAAEAIRYALDIARGMAYLHGHKPQPIIHRDLTPRNLLRDEAGHIKVADFGLSRSLLASLAATTKTGEASRPATSPPTAAGAAAAAAGASDDASDGGAVVRAINGGSVVPLSASFRFSEAMSSSRFYIAPEVLQQKAYDTSVDVFSFGIILFEMFEGDEKARPTGDTSEHNGALGLAPDQRPPFTSLNYPAGMIELISACWDADPSKRPPFTQVLERLEAMQNDLGGKGRSSSILRGVGSDYDSGQPSCCGQCVIL